MVVSCTITTSSCPCHLPLLSLILLLLLLSLTWDALSLFGSSEERAQPPPPFLALSFLLHFLCPLPLLRPLLSSSSSYSSFLSPPSFPPPPSFPSSCFTSSFSSSCFSASPSSFLLLLLSLLLPLLPPPPPPLSTPPPSSSFLYFLLLLQHQTGVSSRGWGCWTAVLVLGFWGCTKMLIVHLANRHRTHFSNLAVPSLWKLTDHYYNKPTKTVRTSRALYTREFDSNALYDVIRPRACTNFLNDSRLF